ncbi:MAG TPA: alpha/beta fold hydrolase [Thermoanaerobaculia bacterium]|nr:alpha/beta fold hydrolase [Thermoanaerobaculia bacterium]
MIRYDDLSLSYLESVPGGKGGSDAMPLVVILHGRGADSQDLAGLAPELESDSGYRFIFPDAPRPFYAAPGIHFGYTWFDGWPPEAGSIRPSRERLDQFLDELHQRYGAGDRATALCGFSQGGMMALDVGLRRPKPLAAIICLSGGLSGVDLPETLERRDQAVLIVHGTLDDMLPVSLGRAARDILEARGLQPEYHELEIGHQISGEEIGMVAAFLHRHLR